MLRPIRGAVRRVRSFDPQQLGGWEFTALTLAILVAAAWLTARGLEAQADLRQRMHVARLQAEAVSPVAYRKPVPVTHRLLAPSSSGRVLALRVDSVADGPEAGRLCALARAVPGVAAFALSDDVPECARPLLASGPVSDETQAAVVRREVRSARLVLIGADGRVLYNRRDLPTAEELRGTLLVLAATP